MCPSKRLKVYTLQWNVKGVSLKFKMKIKAKLCQIKPGAEPQVWEKIIFTGI